MLLGVAPWSYPIYQVVRFARPNLVLGNTVLLKHAAQCPQTALALEELPRRGRSRGVYTNMFVETRDLHLVIESPLVQGVALTGSDRAGAAVAEQAGANV